MLLLRVVGDEKRLRIRVAIEVSEAGRTGIFVGRPGSTSGEKRNKDVELRCAHWPMVEHVCQGASVTPAGAGSPHGSQ